MGCCSSSSAASPEDEEDRYLDRTVGGELQQDKRNDSQVKKLLFLGSGGSGKSTLFKQLRTIHGAGFQDKDRLGYRDHIYSQIVEQIKELVNSMYDLKEEDPDEFGHLKLGEEAQKSAAYMDNVRGDSDVDDEIAQHVTVIWRDATIREVFDQRARLKVDDSSEYFFDEVTRIANRAYIPTDKDILLVRHRTTGVIDQKFEMEGTKFHIFDVGGQRSERKKWIHCFEYVTAVIFVAALSSYDEVMFEDESCNSMEDSIKLFKEICNTRWFVSTAMILFLNKQDLFAEKIRKVPLTICFKEYDGSNDYDEAVGYVKQQFEAMNDNPRDKQIYCHVTCATDKGNVQKVFGDVQHIVINSSLVRGGLI